MIAHVFKHQVLDGTSFWFIVLCTQINFLALNIYIYKVTHLGVTIFLIQYLIRVKQNEHKAFSILHIIFHLTNNKDHLIDNSFTTCV